MNHLEAPISPTPIPIRSPLPWALGRLWILKGSGVVHVRGPNIERIIVLQNGDITGIWHRADDEAIHENEKLRSFFALQPNFMKLNYLQSVPLMLVNLRDIREQLGWAEWRRHVHQAVLDTLKRELTSRTWWLFPASIRLQKEPFISVPEILWDYSLACGPAHLNFARALDIPEIVYNTLHHHLTNDERIPITFRRTVISQIKFLPGRAPELDNERIFLSFFYIPPKQKRREAPVPSPPTTPHEPPGPTESAPATPPPRPANEPSQIPESPPQKPERLESTPPPSDDEPVRLEEYLDRWDHLSAYSYQSERWDHYRVLGLTPNADSETIKQRYKELSRIFHPDRWHDEEERKYKIMARLFDRIRKAYEVLSDEDMRRIYDRDLAIARQGVQVVESREGFIDPKLYKEYLNKGLRFAVKGKYREAIRWLESCERIRPNPQIHAILAYLESFEKERKHQAMKRFETVLQEHPDNPLVMWLFADALFRWGFQARAQRMYKKARKINADLTDSLGPIGEKPLHQNKPLLQTIRDLLELGQIR